MARDGDGVDAHPRVGFMGATALVAGGMIGSGVFLLPATMGARGSISILGWVAATLVALALAGVFAWLAHVAPRARGLADYVQAGLGRFCSVQVAYLYWTCTWVGSAAVAVAVAGYLAFLIPALGSPPARMATTLAIIWFSVLVGWIGPRAVARVEGLTLLFGLAPVLLAATVGWFWFDPGLFARSWNPGGQALVPAIGASALSAIFAFSGLESAAAVAGVVRDPGRNVPRATLAGVALTAALYISACAVLMGILSTDALARSTAPFADAATATVGAGLAAAVAVFAAVRTWGCFTTSVLTGPETTRTAADTGAFLSAFRTRPGERVSPINLITFGVLMSAVALATVSPKLGDQFSMLANVSVLLLLYAYVLAAASLVRLAGTLTPGRRAMAILTAAVSIAACAALCVSAKPTEIAWSLAAVAVGVILFLQVRRQERPA